MRATLVSLCVVLLAACGASSGDDAGTDMTAHTDAGGGDAGHDAGGTDAGGTDGGGVDAGGIDAGGIDAGGTDAGGVDAGGIDLGGGGCSPPCAPTETCCPGGAVGTHYCTTLSPGTTCPPVP